MFGNHCIINLESYERALIRITFFFTESREFNLNTKLYCIDNKLQWTLTLLKIFYLSFQVMVCCQLVFRPHSRSWWIDNRKELSQNRSAEWISLHEMKFLLQESSEGACVNTMCKIVMLVGKISARRSQKRFLYYMGEFHVPARKIIHILLWRGGVYNETR